MKRVEITNILTCQKYAAQIEDPSEWILSCLANRSWGKEEWACPKKGIGYPNEEAYDDILVIEEFEKEISKEEVIPVYERDKDGTLVLDKDGKPVQIGTETRPAVFQTWVRLRAEYDMVITDITEEYNLRLKLDNKIAIGNKVEKLSKKLLQLIVGDNVLQARDGAKRDTMKKDFALIYTAISEGSLKDAKALILEIDIDKFPEYKELQDDILALYKLEGY